MRHSVIGIVGQSEYGKTYLTNKIIKRLERVVVIDPKAEFSESFFVKDEVEEVIANLLNDKFRLSAQFDSIKEYELLFVALKSFKNYTLVFDEISLFCSSYSCNEDIRQIVQIVGSKNAINVIWNAQRPANVSRDISSQTHAVISFRVLESADSKYFMSYWRKGQGEQVLTQLKVGEYRLVRGDKETLEKSIKNLTLTEKNSIFR